MAGFPKSWSRPARSPRPRRPVLRLEGCEDRTVPAVVTATVAGGVLTLTAVDAAGDETLTVTPTATPGMVHVAGTGGTTIKVGNAAASADVDIKLVKSVTINLKGGDDSATLQGVKLVSASFNAGPAGDKTFVLTGGTVIGGNVSVTTGSGSDTLTVNGGTRIGGNLTANLGAGLGSTVDISGNVYVGGYVKLTDTAAVGNTSITDTTVGGYLKSSQTYVAYNFSLTNTSVGGNLDVNVSTVVNSPDPPSGGEVALANSKVGGTVKVTGGKVKDTVTVNDLTAGGKATFALGDGLNTLYIDVTLGLNNNQGTSITGSSLLGGLEVTAGNKEDTVGMGSQKPVLVGGPVKLNLGSEAPAPNPMDPPQGDTVSIDDTTFLDTVSIDFGGGRGMDTLNIEQRASATGLSTFADKLTVTMGADADTVNLGITNNDFGKVLFGVAPSIDGGEGVNDSDTLNRSNGEIDGTSIGSANGFFKNFEVVVPPVG